MQSLFVDSHSHKGETKSQGGIVPLGVQMTSTPVTMKMLATLILKMTGETPEVSSDKKKPRMLLRHHRTS